MSNDVVIRVEGLWKRYGLPLPGFMRRGRHWLHSLRNGRTPALADGPWALRDVSFEVKRGETLGLIGRNGAGKSTLLKVLAGVTPPTRGRVDVRGRIFPMIELNAGLHRELTGRENVHLLGAVMGLSRREIQAKMPEIEAFCELGEWFDRPVRMYSSGMLARLGFGVAMNVDADILLVDEVLAVGDLNFQRKCYNRIGMLRRRGVTTLFVSHAIRQVERLCDRAILLHLGKVRQDGYAVEVANAYYALSDETSLVSPTQGDNVDYTWQGTGDIKVTRVTILDGSGNITKYVELGKPMTICVEIMATCYVEQPIIGIGILSQDMIQITGFSNEASNPRPSITGTAQLRCKIPEVPLLPGNYTIRIRILSRYGNRLFMTDDATRFSVVLGNMQISRRMLDGLIRLKVCMEWQEKQ